MKWFATNTIKKIKTFRLEWRPMVDTLLIMMAATALSFVLHEFFIQNNNVSMIYALAVLRNTGVFLRLHCFADKRNRRELFLYAAVLGVQLLDDRLPYNIFYNADNLRNYQYLGDGLPRA